MQKLYYLISQLPSDSILSEIFLILGKNRHSQICLVSKEWNSTYSNLFSSRDNKNYDLITEGKNLCKYILESNNTYYEKIKGSQSLYKFPLDNWRKITFYNDIEYLNLVNKYYYKPGGYYFSIESIADLFVDILKIKNIVIYEFWFQKWFTEATNSLCLNNRELFNKVFKSCELDDGFSLHWLITIGLDKKVYGDNYLYKFAERFNKIKANRAFIYLFNKDCYTFLDDNPTKKLKILQNVLIAEEFTIANLLINNEMDFKIPLSPLYQAAKNDSIKLFEYYKSLNIEIKEAKKAFYNIAQKNNSNNVISWIETNINYK